MMITQNGEAEALLQHVVSFKKTQETLALLKLLAAGNKDLDAGKNSPTREVVGSCTKTRPMIGSGPT
ncbi:MAG: hypothetical protein ACTHP8_16445 [Bosea sp. (in: a-proteobacteria)]|uniref:hypothetical protein n=1 Tax=Bosea sp. (in: a-proteobacteria) TaxID=1871050 RepID=UPI003F7BE0AB